MSSPEEEKLVTEDTQEDLEGSQETPDQVEVFEDEQEETDPESVSFSWKKLWSFTGPGWLMSIAYLDPGNIESDLQAGAIGGYSLLWVLLIATIMGLTLQILAARLGVVTGKNLAEHCREQYPVGTRVWLWIMTELAIIGSDVQEVVGSAIAIKVLSNGVIPLWGGVLITAADTFTFLLLERRGIRKLEAFFAFLIFVMAITFGVEYGLSKPDQAQVMKGLFVPGIDNGAYTEAVGILGAVIMPHNIYLHSALVQSRKIKRNRPHKVKEANFYNAIESTVALFVSLIINLFVVVVFAATFYYPGSTDNIGLEDAAYKIGEAFGNYAKYVWAIGLLAAGQSSTMTGTYAGQFVMEGFINMKLDPWKRVLITRTIAIVPAMLVALSASRKLDKLDEWLNVLQSVQLPFALIPVLVFTMDSKIMGEFKNNLFLTIFCWLIAIIVMVTNVSLIVTFTISDDFPRVLKSPFFYAFMGVLAAFYFAFIIYIIFWRTLDPLIAKWRGQTQYTTISTQEEEDQVDNTGSIN